LAPRALANASALRATERPCQQDQMPQFNRNWGGLPDLTLRQSDNRGAED
jgi:hypothetical protein